VICVPLDIPEICAPNQAFAIPAATIKLTHYHGQGREFASSATQCRSNRSPAAVSRKREYFKYLPETISDFAPTTAGFGGRRLIADSQKPAIGGHFSAH
jgi:hypothetical protein